MSSDLVKSAARAMEILELFAERREPMSSTELGAALGYPKSSLSVLLRSLAAQGYLSTIGQDGQLFPTMKLARLGDWIPEALVGSASFLPTLEALRDKTGETVTLTMASGFNMRVLHALIGTHPISLRIEEGVSFPMIGTAVGTMYLAGQSDEVVARTLMAWESHASPAERRRLAPLRDEIAEARARGYSRAYDAVLPDTGALSMLFPLGNNLEPLIVTVAGLSQRLSRREKAIVRIMRRIIDGAG